MQYGYAELKLSWELYQKAPEMLAEAEFAKLSKIRDRLPYLQDIYVTSARGVAADAHRPELAAGAVEADAAAEHIDAARLQSEHRVVGGAVIGRVAAVDHARVDRVAELQAVQRVAVLCRGEQVGGR